MFFQFIDLMFHVIFCIWRSLHIIHIICKLVLNTVTVERIWKKQEKSNPLNQKTKELEGHKQDENNH